LTEEELSFIREEINLSPQKRDHEKLDLVLKRLKFFEGFERDVRKNVLDVSRY